MTTYVDKDRTIPLMGNGKWNPITIKNPDDRILRSVKPEPGRYLLQYQLLGRVEEEPTGRMDLRVERYPYDDEDNGTAWDSVYFTDRNGPHWFCTRHAIVTVNASGASTRIGLMYLFRGGKVTISQRVYKFELLR